MDLAKTQLRRHRLRHLLLFDDGFFFGLPVTLRLKHLRSSGNGKARRTHAAMHLACATTVCGGRASSLCLPSLPGPLPARLCG
jgi:hypothetical protein